MIIVCSVFWAILYNVEATVRLVGPSTCEGRVEIFYGNAWGTVCAGMWDLTDAQVVCKELNCGTAIEVSTNGKYGPGAPYSGLTYFQCTGIEKELMACPFTILPHSHIYTSDSGVKCTDVFQSLTTHRKWCSRPENQEEDNIEMNHESAT